MDPNSSAEEMDAVRAALRRGNKIEAIKLYREATGSGLKEAKDAVEAMEREPGGGPGDSLSPLSREDPFARRKTGCLGLLASLAVLAGALVWLCRI